jgi:predicted enzyme related to lactoylglutathione lyase
MADVKAQTPGDFCWAELATTDQDAAKTFYTSIFDWGVEDIPIGEQGVFTMLKVRGKQASALFKMGPETKAQVPPHWSTFIAVTSADDAAKKIESAGGKVVQKPFDVMDVGRMAVAQDPTGATFAVWQAKRHKGFEVSNEPGAVCWNELLTRDVAAATKFYGAVFGWKPEVMKMAGVETYTVFKIGDTRVGGMMEAPPQMASATPRWIVYFAVTSADATADKTAKLGGKTISKPQDIPNVGRFAVLQDPQGATFAILQPKM